MHLDKNTLERKQIWIYIITLLLAAGIGAIWENGTLLSVFIEPVIAILLYSMFCQIPFLYLKQAFQNKQFFKALLVGNFIFIPFIVWLLTSMFLNDNVAIIAVLLVLLTPCIDYVIVFTHMGKGNSNLMLAATPALFVLQMFLLPVYLYFFVGKEALSLIEITPFVKTFLYLIIIPFTLSLLTQFFAKTLYTWKTVHNFSGWLPVPFMALTIFLVVISHIPLLVDNLTNHLLILPLYFLFHTLAPFIGWISAKMFNLKIVDARTVCFSTSTRNSLVVLPLGLALPAPYSQIMAAIIVLQTIVELAAELVYIKLIPRFIKAHISKQ